MTVERILLSGNEAIARGAWEAGVLVGVGYPGTPSTEILQNLAKMAGIHAEWAPNEKVAFEVAVGASLGGARTLVTMKHVGLNVAADVLFTAAYTGIRGGLVVVVADDPGMHSSQNEQDSRNYAEFSKVPMLEPSDSTEALEFTKLAFELSERFDTPVLVRPTVRISHSKGLVATGERVEATRQPYVSDVQKYVMMPGMAKKRRVVVDQRLRDLAEYAETTPLNRVERHGTELGVITGSVAYQYVAEVLPEASILKLGLTFPLPAEKIREFAATVERLVVVEELDPYYAQRIRALGVALDDVPVPYIGELSPARVAEAFGEPLHEVREPFTDLPPRPPVLCAGCPHRGVYHVLRGMDAVVTGDIGCYTLGALPPLSSMDTCVCMGASIGMAHGMELAGQRTVDGKRPVVAVIGDSTFIHSGITGLIDIVYNKGASTVIILDNRITAMTGHQHNPASGRTLMGEPSHELDLEALCRAIGVEDVLVVDPALIKPTERAIAAAVESPGPSVVIARRECALLTKDHPSPFAVDDEVCDACGACIRLGCPAISKTESGRAEIDISQCVGCRLCVQVCTRGAIARTGPACDLGGV